MHMSQTNDTVVFRQYRTTVSVGATNLDFSNKIRGIGRCTTAVVGIDVLG